MQASQDRLEAHALRVRKTRMRTTASVYSVPKTASPTLLLRQSLLASVWQDTAGREGGLAVSVVWDSTEAALTLSASNAQRTQTQHRQRLRVSPLV